MDTDSRTTTTLARPPLRRFCGRAVRDVFRFHGWRVDRAVICDFAECLGYGLCVEHCGSGGLTLEIDPAGGLPLDLDLAREVFSRGKHARTHARTADN
jgi:hypothetical protein